MSQPNKPSEKGFKPGANMPHEGYDPNTEGMSQSGNHASGSRANDTPTNQQSAATTAKAVTHRDRTAGARGDKADGKR
ncbi:hypothetical protein SAMN05216319_1605 [Duganella sp. CF402]|uniref:hypothetical protein n=1 Tax=unclassified Duganella TaxID=2636909 RepID=UPI0008B2AC2F|nr:MULTISPECIES: hypothetical protein [unclassified Duganella]RZT09949.1 hypothetical protein EV582_2022 [Duganella sp. BK701]SEL35717.1 hypothetical protein SAMN05216319_1605 [Duganella sp. CF402]